jgi:uncharacterized membrane protein YbhN (UPF0104 family)
MQNLNIWFLLLLIPAQIFSYFAAGQMYFSYLKAKRGIKISGWKLTRVSLEMNFVKHVFPSGGLSGLGYFAWRFREYHVSAGQATFMQLLRFGVSAVMNAIGMILAIIILIACGVIKNWIYIWLGLAVALGMLGAIAVAIFVAHDRKRIYKFGAWSSRVINWLIGIVTFGHKKQILKAKVVDKFFMDLHHDFLEIKKNRAILYRPLRWGVIYAVMEISLFWLVAIAIGHPEVLPQIMLAEGVASVAGMVMPTPGGAGGYEGAFIATMIGTGAYAPVSWVTVIVSRVLLVLSTIIFGWGFYQHALIERKVKKLPVEAKK